VQLYETALALLLLGLFLTLERRALRPQLMVVSAAICYTASRVAVELVRA
jgi:prolipoprotein diacylglyceryltransferase